MRIVDQLEAFKKRLELWEELQEGFRERLATGASNTPFPVKGGFRIGIWNIENTDFLGLLKQRKSLVVVCPITLPPGDFTICNAFVFKGDVIEAIGRRRDEIRVELDKRPNNVAFFLHRSGLLLSPLTDITDLSVVDTGTPEIGSPIPVSAACYADVLRSGPIDSPGNDYISFLSDLLWPVPFIRLDEEGNLMQRETTSTGG